MKTPPPIGATGNESDDLYHPSGVRPPKLLLHAGLQETLRALDKASVRLPHDPIQADFSLDSNRAPWEHPLFERVELDSTIQLSAPRGREYLEAETFVGAYDESIRKFAALEGTAFLISHSIVVSDHLAYNPQCLLALHFYTRSKALSEVDNRLQYTENATRSSEQDYMRDKLWFMQQMVPDHSLLFLDGPLIAGDAYVQMIAAIPGMVSRGILPIFVVKNSESDLVIRNDPGLERRFNSDLHWANELLHPGERTSLFRYTDQHRPKNSKVFCYLKSLPGVPLRLEMHPDSIAQDRSRANAALEAANYLAIVQGNRTNPQLRPIAVAETYAREFMRLVSLESLMDKIGVTPTVNETRFGGGVG